MQIAGMPRLSTAICIICFVNPAWAQTGEERFFCSSLMASGFKWLNGAWTVTPFKTDGEQYVVEPSPGPLGNYRVMKMGEENPYQFCERATFENKPSSRIICGGQIFGMVFDLETLRFQEIAGFGYLDGKDGKGGTPSLTIGKCSPIR